MLLYYVRVASDYFKFTVLLTSVDGERDIWIADASTSQVDRVSFGIRCVCYCATFGLLQTISKLRFC